MSNNLNIIKNAINAKNKALDSKVEAFCIVCANEAYAWLETNKKEWKNDTYNLIDSTGIAVYKEGTLQSFLELRPKKAISLRRITYHKKKIYVDGRALLESAISAYNSNNTYYEFVLFSNGVAMSREEVKTFHEKGILNKKIITLSRVPKRLYDYRIALETGVLTPMYLPIRAVPLEAEKPKPKKSKQNKVITVTEYEEVIEPVRQSVPEPIRKKIKLKILLVL